MWREIKSRLGLNNSNGKLSILISRTLTFIAVVIAWVFFRAETFGGAIHLLGFMFVGPSETGLQLGDNTALKWLLLSGLVAWFAPNSQQIFLAESTRRMRWQANLPWLIAILVSFTYLLLQLSNVSEFLYFQF